MELLIGTKFKFKSSNEIREAIFYEELENGKIKAVLTGDIKYAGIRVEIDKSQIVIN